MHTLQLTIFILVYSSILLISVIIYYFIMVDCKGKWFYVKAKFFPKKLNIILTVYVFIFYICVYFLIFLRKAFTGQHWC